MGQGSYSYVERLEDNFKKALTDKNDCDIIGV